MKIVCSKSDLIEGLNIVSKAVPSKTTMSILECILIDCTKGDIRFLANDMDLGIETIISGTIKEKGVIALDAGLFFNIIRGLPDSEVTIECDGELNTLISCENTAMNIIGKNGDEFSYLPTVEKNNPVIISQLTLKEVIRQTIFSISDNDVNKMMAGELFEINGDNLRVASLDGHRISIRNIKMKNSYNSNKVIIPGKTLNELSKILSGNDEDDVYIYISDKHVIFEFDNTTVVSRIIEGEYFKIDQMLSDNYETKISINKKMLLDCISRATILIKEGDKRPIILNVGDNNIKFHCNTTVGDFNENISVEKEGKDQMIGFNPKFLIDVLKVIDDENINIYLLNPKSPCFIKDEEKNYIYLVLPVNFTTVG
jgi:DNA polymerase-3 subunit beta